MGPSYAIAYAIGSLIPLIGLAAFVGIIIYVIVQRSNEKAEETFEDRDN